MPDQEWPELLSCDSKMTDETFERTTAHTDLAEENRQFVVKDKRFEQQFAAIYHVRLKTLRPLVLEEGKRTIKGDFHFCKYTMELEKYQGKKTLIIGTLYKSMKLKPRILDEYDEKFRAYEGDNYISDDDSVALEDEYGRVLLISGNKLNVPNLVTGIVAGVVCTPGKGNQAGCYIVEQMVWPGLAKQDPLPSIDCKTPRYVLLTSGLLFGEESHSPLATQLMADYITGFLGGAKDQKFCSHIERVIIAGNSLHRPKKSKIRDFSKSQKQNENLQKTKEVDALRNLDIFLTQLAANVHVDIMPGSDDPTNYTLPQQPLHPCLFTSARTYETLATHTNPTYISSSGVKMLGTSGQNIEDIVKYCEGDRLTHLENTLYWRNVAPTAPDSLACYPFQTNDPFLMKENSLPHIYFAGNQPEFGTKLLKGPNNETVRLVLVPSFCATSTVVLVDLNDLSVHPIKFDTPSSSTTTD